MAKSEENKRVERKIVEGAKRGLTSGAARAYKAGSAYLGSGATIGGLLRAYGEAMSPIHQAEYTALTGEKLYPPKLKPARWNNATRNYETIDPNQPTISTAPKNYRAGMYEPKVGPQPIISPEGVGEFAFDPLNLIGGGTTKSAALGAKYLARGAERLTPHISNLAEKYAAHNANIKIPAGLRSQAGIVKLPNGNWLYGKGVDSNLDDNMRLYANQFGDEAINKPFDDKFSSMLSKYLRNDMGTINDPVRLAHDRGFAINTMNLLPWDVTDDIVAKAAIDARKKAGVSSENVSTTPLGKKWEDLADLSIIQSKAGDLINNPTVDIRKLADQRGIDVRSLDYEAAKQKVLADLEQNTNTYYKDKILKNEMLSDVHPWLNKVPPETPVYDLFQHEFGDTATTNLGFDHMRDVLRNKWIAGEITPEQLRNLNMSKAVEMVHEANFTANTNAADAELKGYASNLKLPRFKEYPSGHFISELPDPATSDEAMALVNKIGCEGGWCTQKTGSAMDYGSNRSRLHTLFDSEGRPHVQFEVKKDISESPTNEEKVAVMKEMQRLGLTGTSKESRETYMQLYPEKVYTTIEQMKPPGNTWWSERGQEYLKRNPSYQNDLHVPMQDFVKSGNWKDVKDLDNAGLYKMSQSGMRPALEHRSIAQELGVTPEDIHDFHLSRPEGSSPYYTEKEFRDFINMQDTPPIEKAHGGLVHSEFNFDEINNYAEGGIVAHNDFNYGEISKMADQLVGSMYG
jgi:nitrite reductase/ring-hydroxylating ferredoxin subunit